MTPSYINQILREPHPLSDSQQEAVLADTRYIRLIAGAGAGKTETLTRRVLYLLFEKYVSPSSIVAFTFTEKAAASMKNRIFKRVLGLGAVEIYNRLGDMYIGTIHGFCNRILEEQYGYGSWEVLDENQEMALLINISDRICLTTGRNTTDRASIFRQSLSVLYNDLLSRDEIKKQAPEFFASVKAYEEYLDQFHLLTFDRMITLALNHLHASPDVTRTISHLIVDEYQDINPAQEALIRTIGQKAIFVVGDPRQTIFQWRGSDEGCFKRFATFYPDVYDIVLPENRRSGRQIVSVANTLASHFRTGPYEPMTATRPDAGAVYRIDYPTSGDEAEGVADQILSLVNSGSCRYQDIGILLRSVNNSATPFIQTLRRYHIPFILSGQVGLFKRQEILALAKIFCWLSPKGFFPASIKDRKNTISGDHLLDSAIDDWFSVVPSVYTKEVVRKTLGYWKITVLENVAYRNMTTAYYNLLSILGFHALSPDNDEDAVVMGNIASFGRVLADFESSQNYGGKTGDILKMVRDLHWFLFLYAYWRYEESDGEQDIAIDAVRLSTVHQAKGLEWPVVFVPALIDGKFPSSRIG
ncbi:MAG: ATP-dependent helicase, partial [Methanobacteriota archaeon]